MNKIFELMRPLILILILLNINVCLSGQAYATEQQIEDGKDSVYQQLQKSLKPEYYMNPPNLSYSSKEYYTEDSKQLLVEVLEDTWMTYDQKLALAKQEVLKRLNNEIDISEAISSDTVKYKDFSSSRRKHFKVYADSLKRLKFSNLDTMESFQVIVQEQIQRINARRMPNIYIYTSGMMDDERFIPILQELLSNSVKYDINAVKLALARYKVEPYNKQILDENKIDINELKNINLVELILLENNKIFPRVAFLCNQEIVREYAKLLHLNHFDCIDEGDYQICSVPSSVIIGLDNILLNNDFKAHFKNISPYTVTDKQINWALDWIKKNYGNYELNRNFYPGLR